jgi:hypothetical protein
MPCMRLIGDEHSHATLLIKIPTRDRYERFFYALDQYYQLLSYNVSYHFVISCDLDDLVMNSERAIEKLKSYPNLSFYFGEGISKIEACNRDVDKHLDFDILILGSDDMIPIIKGYDEVIVSEMMKWFPDYDGVLHFNDGYNGRNLNTLSIMGSKYYNRFGYIYFPKYSSFFCDNEFMEVSRLLNKMVYLDTVIIEHRHYKNKKCTKDKLYKRNEKYWNQDKQLYSLRLGINFGLFAEDELQKTRKKPRNPKLKLKKRNINNASLGKEHSLGTHYIESAIKQNNNII